MIKMRQLLLIHSRISMQLNRNHISIPRSERVPFVYIAPNEYRTLGNDFDFRTWKSYGQWNYSLIENRDNLPGNIRDQLLERIKDKKTKLEKIKEIYRFVQQNTRYVNTNIGIGGWQPVDAGTVAIKGYGDCKGLVNYTKALMSLAGITSYYTVTNADQEIQDIFPRFSFQSVQSYNSVCSFGAGYNLARVHKPVDALWIHGNIICRPSCIDNYS